MAKFLLLITILFLFDSAVARYSCDDIFVMNPVISNFRKWLRDVENHDSAIVIAAIKRPEHVEIYADATLSVINEWLLLTNIIARGAPFKVDLGFQMPEYRHGRTMIALHLLLDNTSDRLLYILNRLEGDMSELVIHHPSLSMVDAASAVIYQTKIQKYHIKKIEGDSQSRVRQIYFGQ